MPQSSQGPRKRKPLTQLPIEETDGGRKRSRAADSDDEQDTPICGRRAGTVNYMILKNFMCHSLLEVDFTSNNISMVIGKNGSGKSAILTALIVGLGGKANLTNRGSSVKGFVKVGKNSGSVELQLCNEGPMAYRPRVYGKSITIIRNLNASEGGSYRVKSAEGEVIATQAKEVQNITASLNIQVDDPICLLTQDTSRNFLSSNDPKNKFTLFMRATRLEMLEAEYKRILNNKKDCSRILDDKKSSFRKLQEKIRRLKRKIDGHQSIVNLIEKKLTLQKEMLWSQVKDVEEELQVEQKKVDKVIKKMEDFRTRTEKKAQEVDGIQENIREYERQISELKEQIEIQKRPQNDLKRQIEELQAAHNTKKREKQGIGIEITTKNKDVEYLEQEIANANKSMSKVEQQKKEGMKNLAKMQEKLKGFDNQLETARNELFQIKNDGARKQDDESNLQSEIKQIDNQIANEKGSLQALQRESGNTLMVYGRNIPKVKEMIRQYKDRCQHEPKGPLAHDIREMAADGVVDDDIIIIDNNEDEAIIPDVVPHQDQEEVNIAIGNIPDLDGAILDHLLIHPAPPVEELVINNYDMLDGDDVIWQGRQGILARERDLALMEVAEIRHQTRESLERFEEMVRRLLEVLVERERVINDQYTTLVEQERLLDLIRR